MRRIACLLFMMSLGACGSDSGTPTDTTDTGVGDVPDTTDTGAGDVPDTVDTVDVPDTTDTTDVPDTTDTTDDDVPDTSPATLSWSVPASGSCHVVDTVTVSGVATHAEGQSVRLVGDGPDGGVDVAFATVADGAWSGTFSASSDGTYEVSAALETTQTAPVVFVVDRVAPTVAFTVSDRIDGLSVPDQDPADGYQIAVTVTAIEATSPDGEVCLATNDGAPQCKPIAAEVTFVVTLEAGSNLLTATATDGCGHTAQPVTAPVSLVFDNPVAITSPSGVLLARDDADPATSAVYDTTFAVSADRAVPGATLTIACRAGDGGFAPVATYDIETIENNYEIPVVLDTAVFGHEVECRVSVDEPAPGTSESVALTLAIPAPSFTFATTPACIREDLAVSGTASGLDGRVVAVGFEDAASFDVTVAQDAWAGVITLGALADGDYTLTATATDTWGNALADHDAPRIPIAVDRTAPTVTVSAPLGDVTGDDDAAPAQAGMQIELAIAFADRAGGEVCVTHDHAPLGCRSALDGVVFDVTIQGGINTFELEATDACGNVTTIPHTVFFATESPVVTIVTPAADLSTADTAIDFVVTVTEPDRTTALPGLAVRLFTGDTELAFVPSDLGDGRYRFDDVPLPSGVATAFTARAPRPGSVGVSAPRIVTQKNVAPQIAITSPTAGTINLDSAVCVGAPDCQLVVTAQTTDAEDGAAAALDVNCGTDTVRYVATVTSASAEFSLTLAHGQTCILTPSVTDLVGQERVGAEVTVLIDRVAPTVVFSVPPNVLLAQHDLDAAQPGIQTLMRVDVGGVAAGAEVVSELSWTDLAGPTSRRLTHLVQTATPEGATYTATFEDTVGTGRVTWPEGVVTWRVEVIDPAGNRTIASRLVTVDSEASVRITGPTTTIPNQCVPGCGSNAVCQQSTCWLLWGTNTSRQIVAVVGGLDTQSQNLRVCSDSAALETAGAPICGSTHPSGGVFRQALITTAAVGINALDMSNVFSAGVHRVVVEVLPHDGGAWVSSHTAVATGERERRLFLDLTAPVVSSVTSPSDTALPLGTLNAAEQKEVPRIYDIAFQTDEAGTAEVMVNGIVAATRAVTAGITTVSVTLPEGTPQVWVVVSDAAGNRSRLTPALGATTYTPIVDVTAPTLSFNRPNASPLKGGDNLDVVVASNAEGRTVTLYDGGVQVATAVVSAGFATFPHATFGVLSDGTHTLSASVSDTAQNPATAVTTPASISVDTVAPLGVIVSPTDPTFTTDLEDSDPDTHGFQLDIEFLTSQGAVSWSLWTASGCSFPFQGCAAPIQRASGAVTNSGGPEPVRRVTLELNELVTQHKVLLRTVDAVGNVHTAEVGVQVLVMSCAISFRGLPESGWFNAQQCATPPSCAATTIEVQVGFVGLCGANRLRLFDGDQQLGEDRLDPSSSESFFVDVTDGEALALEARAFRDTEQVGSTGQHEFGVDLTPPVARFVATTVGGFVTPASDEHIDYAASDDLAPHTAGLQIHLAVEVADTHVEGGAITHLVAVGDTTVGLVPSNGLPRSLVGASPVSVSLLDVTLASGQTHTVTATATDAAGNVGTASFTATVDVVAPAAVVLDDTDADPRGPRVTLTWASVGDDEHVGTVAGYEVRYASIPLDDASWDAACDAAAIYGSDPLPAPAAPGALMSVTFGGPDTRPWSDPCKLEHYFQDATPGTEPVLYWGVRAVDDLGNRSPLSTASTWTATRDDLVNKTSRVRFDNTNNAFGAASLPLLTRRGAILGDIDGDGIADWATGSRNANAFCVFRGRADQPAEVVVDTLTGTHHACFLGSQAGVLFAGANQAGHYMRALGDINGDGIDDFGVSGKITTTESYVAIWLGQAGVMPDLSTPHIRIRGLRTLSTLNEFLGFCSAGDFDGVPSNGRMTADIAVGESLDSKVHVIPGQGTWGASTRLLIDVSVAGTLASVGAWTVQATGVWGAGAGSPPQLGTRCARGGDLLPTPAGLGSGAKDDLIVYQQGSLDARVFVFPGREWTPGTVEYVSECVTGDCSAENPPAVTAEDGRSVRLRQEVIGMFAGYGSAFQGDIDLTGDGVPDIIVTNPGRSIAPSGLPDGKSIYIFDGAKVATRLGSDVRIDITSGLVGGGWTGAHGWVLHASVNSQPGALRAVGDFDEWQVDGAPSFDVAFGSLNGQMVELRSNHRRSSAGIALGQFPVMDGAVTNRFSSVDNAIGQWIDGGSDLDGDGRVDMITGGNVGDVILVH